MNKKRVSMFFVLFLFIIGLSLWSSLITNNDKPERGRWDFGLKKVWSIESAGGKPLVNVKNIQIDNKGNIFFMDRKYQKIAGFDPEGKEFLYFGKRGEGPGEIRRMVRFFLKGSSIIIEERGGRLHYFSKKGLFINTLRFNPRYEIKGFVSEYKFVAILSNYGTKDEKKDERMEMYDIKNKTSTLLATLSPEEIVSASNGNKKDDFYIEVHIDELTPSVLVDVSRSSIIYGKNNNYVLNKINFSGEKILSFSLIGRPQIEVSKKDKKKILRKGIPPQILKKLIKALPDKCTYFTNIYTDKKGFVYFYTSNLSDKSIQGIDVFSSSGHYLYRSTISFPDGLTPVIAPVFAGNFLYVFAEDEEGERSLIKYKINMIK